MKQLHLHSLTVTWLCSYLTKHHQSIAVNGATSHSIPVISGVPQAGSILGPLLFLIYMHRWHLYTVRLSEGSKLSLYADDMLLCRAITSPANYAELQHNIDQFYGWSAANLMTFNVSKCKCMLVSRRRNADFATTPVHQLWQNYIYP